MLGNIILLDGARIKPARSRQPQPRDLSGLIVRAFAHASERLRKDADFIMKMLRRAGYHWVVLFLDGLCGEDEQPSTHGLMDWNWPMKMIAAKNRQNLSKDFVSACIHATKKHLNNNSKLWKKRVRRRTSLLNAAVFESPLKSPEHIAKHLRVWKFASQCGYLFGPWDHHPYCAGCLLEWLTSCMKIFMLTRISSRTGEG